MVYIQFFFIIKNKFKIIIREIREDSCFLRTMHVNPEDILKNNQYFFCRKFLRERCKYLGIFLQKQHPLSIGNQPLVIKSAAKLSGIPTDISPWENRQKIH